MGTISDEIHHVPCSIGFSIFATEEIRKLSKVEITSIVSVNDLGQPLPGGLYDLSMGPYTRDFGVCSTCHLNFMHCPGHLGHIELVVPVINPLLRSVVFKLLSRTCLRCSALLYSGSLLVLTQVQLELLEMGLAAEALTAADMVSATAKKTKVDRNVELVDLADTGVAVNTDQSTNKLLSYLSEVKDQHARGSIVREVRNVVLERRAVIQRFLAHKPSKHCPSCQHTQPSLNDFGGQIIRIDLTSSRKKKSNVARDDDDSRSYVTASEARQVLRKLWMREKTLLCHVFGMLNTVKGNEHPTDCFFLEVLPVTAPRFRPMDSVNGRTVEHTQTYVYATIVECSRLLRQLVALRRSGDSLDSLPAEQQRQLAAVRGDTLDDKVMRCWRNLQGLVDCVVDTDMSRAMSNRLNSTNLRGIKQVLEKKEGIFRMNMMGKRVDFAGRTVITPDPYLSVEEMGVPEVMATKLTYPEPVTPQNLTVLQRAVLNGPSKHPGANAIQLATGVKVVLRNDPKQLASIAASLLTPSEEQSRKLMGPKIVHRHLLTGDAVLLNRQPTLHRPSIMAHRVRVLPGEKTFRLHYSNCKSYNADFDGDEMNMHLPQGEEGRSEAYNLMFSPNHYLVPKDGTPLGGLIQDHVVAGVRLTMRGTFFERAEYQQLVASGLGEHRQRVRLLPPAVLRPRRLWTGKQVVSTILINLTPADWPAINLRSISKLSHKIWQQQPPRPCTAGGAIVEPDMSEGEVIIRGGHLLCGVLDKQQFGAVPFSLVHGFYELYGGVVSSRLLSGFSRLFTCCLHRMGFTLGVKDILVTAAADRQRRDVIGKSVQIGVEATADALGLVSQETRHDPAEVRRRLEQVHLSGSARATRDLDRAYKQRLDTINNNINKVCLPVGLIQSFPDNNLQLMVESGAKGSKVNAMQISCLLGQIELEGKRPPRMVSGKTLPSFEPYDLTPRAGGFIASRFMTGIRPQEYFFHCMAGREGLIDTAVKTSRSGYLQRCLIKHLEGLVVNYDSTVRDSDGSVIQFRYGEDGCETQKMPYLTQKQMTFFDDNHRGVLDSRLVDSFKRRSDLEGIRKHRKKVRKWCREFGDPRAHRRTSQFLEFCRLTSIPDQQQRNRTTNRPLSYHHAVQMWNELDNTKLFRSRCRRCPDPVDSVYPPSSHFSSMCERLEAMIGDYLEARPDPSAELEDLLRFKVATATVQPGEAVGLIAGQSVGEPSTQMTLNTFHFAGLGDMNVTLGIPRLREILSASKSLKTPSMEIPFRKDVPDVERRANRLKLQLSRVTLAQVLRDVTVTERCLRGQTRVYQLRMCFLPRSAYKEEFAVRPADVLRYVEDVWIRRFLKLLAKTFKLKDVGSVMEKERRAAAKGSSESAEAADEVAEGEEAVDEPSTSNQKTPTEDEEISDGEAGQDDDATAARSRARRNDEAEYESEEEEEEEESFAEMDLQEDDDEEDLMGVQRNKGPTSVKARTETVLTLALDNCRVKSYTFDEKRNLWCQFTIAVSTSRQCDIQTLVTEAAGIAVIREVPSISRVFVIKDEKHGLRLCTEGINMAYFAHFSELLDLNRMYCNDVHSMASTYGIEAATKTIVKEITSVFEVYGIQVSRRHLSLIADYMTFSGLVRGFTRWAMDSVVSPLQQMSFETTVNFLRTAILAGQVDDLRSPSARLVLGQPMIGGTGMFSLVNKMIVGDYL